MDVAACREYLDKLLTAELAALQRLEGLLEREHESLLANDFASFEQAGKAREVCVGKLVCVEDERQALCRAMSVSTDRQDLERLIVRCDDGGTLLATWGRCLELAARCRVANDRNGKLVNTRLGHVQSVLDILTDRPGRPKTYGRQGAFQAQQSGARVLVSA